jgi:NAD(P)-dependent dehydrogenase (short-subunit alcohol dehydrogenase family)
VTGGSSGIGEATARRLAREGGSVAILARDEQKCEKVASAIRADGAKAVAVPADLANVDEIEAAVDRVTQALGRIDVLVNDAAMMTFKPITELSVDEWETLVHVNLRSVFLLCKLCLPGMQGGAIVNVSSVHAHETTPNVVPYATSKGGLEAFTRGLSREVPPEIARINAVAPGAVDTPMLWDNPNVKSGREKVEGAIGQPDDIAAAIAFVASDEARFINGTTLVVDGGRLDIL